MNSNQVAILELNSICKNYYIGTENELAILKNVSLKVNKGEFISIVGASGSGKSTFMNIIGALDRPTKGTYSLNGEQVEALGDDELSNIRNKGIGFIFQNFNLIPRCSALRNVELPMLYAGLSRVERTKKAKELLEIVGMGERMHHQPNELSGGQKQRVAIARALANNPAIILADEPTGALDSKTGNMIMDLFLKINRQEHKTIILITHSQELAQQSDRIVTIADGEIISDRMNKELYNA
ncbi:ABC transporter ATP-binding protein [Cellulosilyticum sp. I15G10I2]|uniref:ABC transporter ATP-binding protein n=1 Tax=Cellulosilyticum sp. I15G10I2 TaxID=1892843 RepID=UPI00085C8C6C|nr:ABC transporter ATP-binding protein [Cellulosilyticum sp. I15G10I2]